MPYGAAYGRYRPTTMQDLLPQPPAPLGGPRTATTSDVAWGTQTAAGANSEREPRTPPTTPTGGGPENQNPDVPGTPPPSTPTPPTTTPQAGASRGSAWKDYGDQDIPGAKESGIWWGNNASAGYNLSRTKDDRGAFTTKNVLGMILTRYPAKPSSIDAFLNDPDTKKWFPNARKVGFDKVDLGDGPIDILTKADPETDTAEAWWFNPEGAVTAHGADFTPWNQSSSSEPPPDAGAAAAAALQRREGFAYERLAAGGGRYRGPTMEDLIERKWR